MEVEPILAPPHTISETIPGVDLFFAAQEHNHL